MACPFNVAKFEFDKAVPKIVKCELCRHRVGEAKLERDGDFSRYSAARARLLRGSAPAGRHLTYSHVIGARRYNQACDRHALLRV